MPAAIVSSFMVLTAAVIRWAPTAWTPPATRFGRWSIISGDFAATTLSEVVNFVYTSDNHYGIIRPIFRGNFNVPSPVVNEAMIARMNTLPAQSFPNDGGVGAGQSVGHVDFLMDTGDLANRSESQSAIAATNITYLGAGISYPGNSALHGSRFRRDLGTMAA